MRNEHIITFTILLSAYTEQLIQQKKLIIREIIIILKILLIILSFNGIDDKQYKLNFESVSKFISIFLCFFAFVSNIWFEKQYLQTNLILFYVLIGIIILTIIYIYIKRFIINIFKYTNSIDTESDNIQTYILCSLLVTSSINEVLLTWQKDTLLLTYIRLILTILFINHLYINDRFNLYDVNSNMLLLTVLSYVMSIVNITIKDVIKDEDKEKNVIKISNISFSILFSIIILNSLFTPLKI